MSERKFKFVSPGVEIREIDRSQVGATPGARGPLVIGRTERGPAMRPTMIQTFNEFVQTFGAPIPGGRSGDIWRAGNYSSPTYASYAAQAYLRNNGPVTVVRLIGTKHANATSNAGTPGWQFANYAGGGGAQGLFLFYSGSSLHTLSGTLAAIFYFNDADSGIKLNGVKLGASAVASPVTSQGMAVASVGDTYEFKAQLYGSNTDTVTFNFDKDSDRFIRKVFNTNPTLVNTTTNATANQEIFFLGETYEGLISEVLNSSSAGKVMGVVLPLRTPAGAAVQTFGSNHKRDSAYAKSGWIIPQDTNADYATFDARVENFTKLFRFESLEKGEWAARNLKVSIEDIAFSNNKFEDYGTFTVKIRSAQDNDGEPVVLETFEGLNLNPESANYIARQIGDKYVAWDTESAMNREYGQYDNMSKFVRVEIGATIEDGGAAGLLPAGFFGPPRFNTFHAISGAMSPIQNNNVSAFAQTLATASFGAGGRGLDSMIDCAHGYLLTASIAFPKMKLRSTSDDAVLARPTDAYYGVDTRRNSPNGRVFDPTYYDLVRSKPANVDSFASSSLAPASFIFSMDDISASFSGSNDYNVQGVYAQGYRRQGLSVTAVGITGSYKGTSAETGSYKTLLDLGFNKFTSPLFGGFDGFDVTERDPLRNTLISSTDTEVSNWVVNTYQQAIDMGAEQGGLDINLATVPGLTNTTLTERLIDNSEARGDVLAIIDLENDYRPRYDRTTTTGFGETANVGNVTNAVNSLKDRNLNSSYGCAYYPWVLVRDTTTTGQNVWLPPSVVALGVMGNSETNGELWFAPAGFTRGGLSEGMSGLNVLGVRQKLSSKERDALYEQNINPISSFPAEGLVIFGQKTLQVTPSALDRINVRRLLIFLKKEISFAASRILFDQNVPATWARFIARVQPLLESVQTRFGLTDFKLVLDETTTTPELIDRNIMYAKIFLKPARSIEYIALDFVITSTGASFEE